jgi:hypothetical protein
MADDGSREHPATDPLIPAHVEYEGHRYRLAFDRCGRCENFWLRPDLPEFAPSWCPYCGMKFRYYNTEEDFRRLNGNPL